MSSFASRFAAFAQRKTDAALSPRFETFKTIVDRSAEFPLEAVGNPFTDSLLDGPFYQSATAAGARPLINLVFVQSADGNTEADDPSALGGGDTDTHVIYEGLSRVAADAVMAGSKTVGDGHLLFSTWHPELVALRRSLGKPRHPVQIVVTRRGELPIEDGLLFNVPEVAAAVLTVDGSATRLASLVRSRPWITVISSGAEPDLRVYAERLRHEHGITRISAIGGRTLATALIDAGLVTDLYLTTSPREGGTPDTPLYRGAREFGRTLVVRKRSSTDVLFEHLLVR